jgi:hypothetical protein
MNTYGNFGCISCESSGLCKYSAFSDRCFECECASYCVECHGKSLY